MDIIVMFWLDDADSLGFTRFLVHFWSVCPLIVLKSGEMVYIIPECSLLKVHNINETLKVIRQEIVWIHQCIHLLYFKTWKTTFTCWICPLQKEICNIRLKNARTTKVDQDLSIFGTCWREMVQMSPRCCVVPLERLCNCCRRSSILRMVVWQEA